MSATIIAVTLGYAIMKVHDLVAKDNPVISQNVIQNYYGNEIDGITLDDAHQHFAISIVGLDGKPKYDSRYVRIMAIYNIKHEDGSQENLGEPLHDCTQEDF